MDINLFLALSTAVERFTEALKPALTNLQKRFAFADDTYNAIVQIIACVAGIFLVLTSNGAINLLGGYPQIPALYGAIITGLVVGGGSKIVHIGFDLLYGSRDVISNLMKPAAPSQTTVEKAAVVVLPTVN